MAWFTTRKSPAQTDQHLLQKIFRHAARNSSGSHSLGKRRAHRVYLTAPVFLYGSIDGQPFSECAETIDVCVNGALVGISAPLFLEQRILLTNLQTEQDLKCRVVRIDNRRKVVALEFLESCPRFWRIEFAPASASG